MYLGVAHHSAIASSSQRTEGCADASRDVSGYTSKDVHNAHRMAHAGSQTMHGHEDKVQCCLLGSHALLRTSCFRLLLQEGQLEALLCPAAC